MALQLRNINSSERVCAKFRNLSGKEKRGKTTINENNLVACFDKFELVRLARIVQSKCNLGQKLKQDICHVFFDL